MDLLSADLLNDAVHRALNDTAPELQERLAHADQVVSGLTEQRMEAERLANELMEDMSDAHATSCEWAQTLVVHHENNPASVQHHANEQEPEPEEGPQ